MQYYFQNAKRKQPSNCSSVSCQIIYLRLEDQKKKKLQIDKGEECITHCAWLKKKVKYILTKKKKNKQNSERRNGLQETIMSKEISKILYTDNQTNF